MSAEAFVQLKFEGQATRAEDGIEAEFSLSSGYGGEASVGWLGKAELVASLGQSISAKAKTGIQVARLISYGLYRRARETNLLPRELIDLLWGTSGAAAAWSARVEREIFGNDEEAQVALAWFAALEGEGGSDGEEGGMGLGIKLMTEMAYNKESLGAQLGQVDKERDITSWGGWLASFVGRGAEKSVGESSQKLELSTEFKLNWGTELDAEVEIALEAGGDSLIPEFKGFEMEISGQSETAPRDLGFGNRAQAGLLFTKMLLQLREFFDSFSQICKDQDATAVGLIAPQMAILGNSIYKDRKRASNLWANAHATQEKSDVSDEKMPIKISYGVQKEAGKKLVGEFGVDYVSEYSYSTAAMGAQAELKLKKNRKVFTLKLPKEEQRTP